MRGHEQLREATKGLRAEKPQGAAKEGLRAEIAVSWADHEAVGPGSGRTTKWESRKLEEAAERQRRKAYKLGKPQAGQNRAAGPEADEAIGREKDHAWQDLQHACLTCMERSSTCVDRNRNP